MNITDNCPFCNKPLELNTNLLEHTKETNGTLWGRYRRSWYCHSCKVNFLDHTNMMRISRDQLKKVGRK